MELEATLPSTICLTCHLSAYEAAQFRTLAKRANKQWITTLQLLEHLPDHQYSHNDRLTAIIGNNDMTITIECTKPEPSNPTIEIDNFKRLGKQKDCQCPNCGIKFIYPQHLYKHLKESADLIRACHMCADIMSRDQLIQHLNEEHSIEPYYCKKCPALFLFCKQFKKHMVTAHTSNAHTCVDCGRSFQSSPALYAHLSIHSDRACPNCDKQFRNQKCYTYHVKQCCNLNTKDLKTKKATVTIKHKNVKLTIGKRGSTNKKCICNYCNKVFAGKKFVAAHIQIVHTKDTHKPCKVCGKVFAAAHMSTHFRTHNAITYKCHQCGAILKSKLGFVQHLRLHTGERPYTCQYCGKAFSASSRRSEHVRNVHKKTEIIFKHGCKLCSARFKLPYKLKHHVKRVHGDGSNQAFFECTDCKENFASCRTLLNHSKKYHQ